MRNDYDLSHYSAITGQLGRLQTVSVIPVIANDTMQIDVNGAIRLSPLRTQLTLDAKVEVFVFYDKYRNSYGNTWVQMIKDGVNGTTTLPTVDVGTDYYPSIYTTGSGTIPKHYVNMYNNIWNHYFRIPNNTDEISVEDVPSASTVEGRETRAYGRRIARLPALWNTGVNNANIDNQNYMAVDATGDTFDLIDIAQVKAQYKNEVDRDWFSHRYRDFMSDTFGSTGVHIDADQRPELLYHNEQYLSGYDIDGTSGNTHGNVIGKAAGMVQCQLPPKYFNEHGCVWIMMAVRFPSILQQESHYLSNNTLDYKTISGDPAVMLNERPTEWSKGDIDMTSTSTSSIGHHPFGQYYRTQPNRIHKVFSDDGIEGFPFIDLDEIVSQDDIYYDGLNNQSGSGYYDYFRDQQLAQWNFISQVGISAKRIIPPASKSINAGI